MFRSAVRRFTCLSTPLLPNRRASAQTSRVRRRASPAPVSSFRSSSDEPQTPPTAPPRCSPRSDANATRALNFALCCFLFTPTSYVLWTGQPLAYPAVQKSGAPPQSRALPEPFMVAGVICADDKHIQYIRKSRDRSWSISSTTAQVYPVFPTAIPWSLIYRPVLADREKIQPIRAPRCR